MKQILWEFFENYKIAVWSKIKFSKEKQRYDVIASNLHFTICTKPINIHKTVLYTIIDRYDNCRWPENLVFGMWAETKEQCEDMLDRLTKWETEVSHRHRIDLDLENIYINLNNKWVLKPLITKK